MNKNKRTVMMVAILSIAAAPAYSEALKKCPGYDEWVDYNAICPDPHATGVDRDAAITTLKTMNRIQQEMRDSDNEAAARASKPVDPDAALNAIINESNARSAALHGAAYRPATQYEANTCLDRLKAARGYLDPESLRLEGTAQHIEYKNGKSVIQVMVNAKNAYGAYTGAKTEECD